jgi:proteasome lid subunit RPN8/RPN11
MKPEVFIDTEELIKIYSWMEEAGSDESSGLGIMENTKEGMRVTKAILCKHKGTSGGVDIDADAAAEVYKKYPNKINVWWHTHPTFGVTPSATDVREMDETMKFLKKDQFRIMLILNKKGETKCQMWYKMGFPVFDTIKKDLELKTDFKNNFTIGPYIFLEDNKGKQLTDRVKAYKAEFRAKKEKSSFVTYNGWGHQTHLYNDKRKDPVKDFSEEVYLEDTDSPYNCSDLVFEDNRKPKVNYVLWGVFFNRDKGHLDNVYRDLDMEEK